MVEIKHTKIPDSLAFTEKSLVFFFFFALQKE